ncbi:MAG: hypothetical protein Q4D42_07845 [Eubacteriales bacterium]|nr:hypothetical protein [Eubacteriales bacterium]
MGDSMMQYRKTGPYRYIQTEEIEQDILQSGSAILHDCYPKFQDGDINTFEYIGFAYLMGANGLQANFDKAFCFLQAAAQGGSIPAQHFLADCYAYGIGVPEDPETAQNYYRLSAQSPVEEIRQAALQQLERLQNTQM